MKGRATTVELISALDARQGAPRPWMKLGGENVLGNNWKLWDG